MSASSGTRNLLKTIPGLLISAFFLWYTFFPHPAIWKLSASSGISLSHILALRMVHPAWIAGILAFTFAGYGLRCVRWTRMMRPTGASFTVCARVLITSIAANNILPFRIGDVMRIARGNEGHNLPHARHHLGREGHEATRATALRQPS
ncbi:MAG: flippase-like domain-containing protein [Alphaproteobacteria bacterium]|nr:flippase-like domain-containing protein [Alphaproteobacteria bacterium]